MLAFAAGSIQLIPPPMSAPTCLESLDFELGELIASHPPVWKHPVKEQLYQFIQSTAPPQKGALRYSRWELATLPDLPDQQTSPECALEVVPDIYLYDSANPAAWHVNFADPNLFVAYGSGLLAQDEMQVLEHPALGSLREALLVRGVTARTRENGRSTPVLITGAPRLCALDPFPSFNHGREHGLYGNRFKHASFAVVQSALSILNPPTISNVIAISAPTGSGAYHRGQIVDILETAYTAMAAAATEARRIGAPAEIHTGFWGCGAFGGNRPLMALLQVLAAQLAGIDRLVFYTGSQAEAPAFDEGRSLLARVLGRHSSAAIAGIVDAITAHGFTWRVSDGN